MSSTNPGASSPQPQGPSAQPTGSGEPGINVKYKLPETVEALLKGWMSTFQSAAVVTALLAGIESQLLGTISDAVHGSDGNAGIGPTTHSGRALIVLAYLALFLNLSATMSSLLLTQEMSALPARAAQAILKPGHNLDSTVYYENITSLLRRFNDDREVWIYVLTHWLLTLVSGYISLVVQLVLYVWCTELTPVKAAVVFFSIVTTLPLVALFQPPLEKELKSRNPQPGTGPVTSQ